MNPTLEKSGFNTLGLFVDWLLIGLQSFGGGSSTFMLIHQVVMKRQWLTEEEFVRIWALVQVSPGINLLKLTVMIGYRLNGWAGILTAMSGLLLPSAGVTILMTAGFATIRELAWVQALTQGILPATIGLSLAMSIQMAQPLFTRARKQGGLILGAHWAILLGAALLMGLVKLSPVLILVLTGVASMLVFAILPASAQPLEKK